VAAIRIRLWLQCRWENGPAASEPATEVDDCFMVRIQTDPTEYKLGSCSHCTVPRRAPLGLIVAGFGPIAGRMTPCSPPSRCGLARWGRGVRSVRRPTLPGVCARRQSDFAVGAEECSRRGSNKRIGGRRKRGDLNNDALRLDIAIDKGSAIQAVCGKAARTDLCGGREATRVPTAKCASRKLVRSSRWKSGPSKG
jgi:hypothetical protein